MSLIDLEKQLFLQLMIRFEYSNPNPSKRKKKTKRDYSISAAHCNPENTFLFNIYFINILQDFAEGRDRTWSLRR